MRIGAFVENSRGGGGVERYVVSVRKMADAEFSSICSPHVFGLDALTALAVVAIVGDADAVRAQVKRVEGSGATEFVFAPFGDDVDRTVDVMAGLL